MRVPTQPHTHTIEKNKNVEIAGLSPPDPRPPPQHTRTFVLRYFPKAVGRDVSSLPVSGSTIGSDGSWYTCTHM